MTNTQLNEAQDSPFNLDADEAYAQWKTQKLQGYPTSINELVVNIKDPYQLTAEEHARMSALIRQTNMAVYQLADPGLTDKSFMKALGQQFGLQRLDANLCADDDSITSLQTREAGRHAGYIPYSCKKISWHTDGYYNAQEQTVRALILHCARNAPQGGVSEVLDPEILYIHLRDINPDYIRALSEPDAMTIPANVEAGTQIRGAETGPVFSLDKTTGDLHLRYTARTRSIEWKNDPVTLQARDAITKYFTQSSPYIYRHCLVPGQGVICNNVLHNRSAFSEGETASEKRLLFRARYYDHIVI